MPALAERFGVRRRKSNHDWFSGDCPLPQHGTETKGSFKVNAANNKWHCKATTCKEARDGKPGGDAVNFVAWKEGISYREAGVRIAELFGLADLIERGSVPKAPAVAPVKVVEASAVNPPLAFELKGIDFKHPYLLSRGFEEEECEYLGVGVFPGKGSMAGRVVFPIHNSKGELVAYAGRLMDESLFSEVNPRWKFPAGFLRGQELFG